MPTTESRIVEAAPVPGAIEGIEDALGPDGTAVAPAVPSLDPPVGAR